MVRESCRRSLGCLSFLVLLAGAGCGSKAHPMNNAVEGTVKIDGTPLVGVVVQFVPDGEERLPGSSGFTDEQGHFRLTCENQKNGALIGKHRVVLLGGRGDSARRNPPIPNAYTVASSTPLLVEIKPDEHNVDLTLKTR